MKNESQISRRTVAAGAAWAVPSVAVVAVTPAFAASPGEEPSVPPDSGDSSIGLQGLMNIGKGCPSYGGGRYSLVLNATDVSATKPVYDENGQVVEYGFYVLGATKSERPSNAKFTIYVPTSLGTFTWDNTSRRSGWSNLFPDRSVPQYAGMTAYSSTFSGSWVYSEIDGVGRWAASGTAPSWGANPPNLSDFGRARRYCPSGTMPAAAMRTVDVADKTLSFTRGVRSLV